MDNEKTTYPPLHFSGMDINKATNQLAIPAASEKQPLKGREHILLPPRKYLSIRSLLDRARQFIAAERIEDGWLATTVRIQVDFANPVISMQIPNADWLLKPQGKDWYGRFENWRLDCADCPRGLRICDTDANMLLIQPLDSDVREQPYDKLPGLALMQALGEEFGLGYEVSNKMMWSVYRVWAPYRSRRADSAMGSDMSEGEVSDTDDSVL